ncbi:MAG: hypothetical protein V7L14_09960 [Nostoc sp.]|uniref:hypothetical protein n=1 Tax=Nostoc sp. TaxID=1180 RepID=UPI002FFBC28D
MVVAKVITFFKESDRALPDFIQYQIQVDISQGSVLESDRTSPLQLSKFIPSNLFGLSYLSNSRSIYKDLPKFLVNLSPLVEQKNRT